MDNRTIQKMWPVLKRQVMTLQVPWLEHMAQMSRKRDPFKVLISCILSLRTQDRTAGSASERLFKLARNAEDMSRLSVKRIEETIYPVGFYRIKAVSIKEVCRKLIKDYKAKVPDEIEELLQFKGVGRKTANLVVTLGYGKPGICVDTHVHRITNRWGYVRTTSPEETEFALRKKLPGKYWMEINGLLVAFGQGVCKPISPLCSKCGIEGHCKKVGVKKKR